MKLPYFLLIALFMMTSNAISANNPLPPDVEKKAYTVSAPFGATRNDDYYWLRDDKRENPQMLAYLEAENQYADAVMAGLKPLEDELYTEITGRIAQDDSSVPYRERGWWWYSRFETGKDYPIYARRFGDMEQAEQVLLDVNVLAEGKGYFNIGDWEVTQDDKTLAYAEDDVGRRQYKVRFKNLETGELYADVIEGVSPNLVWADDGKTLFYIEEDAETLLTVRVKKHVLGTDVSSDVTVYEEADDSFYLSISRSRDDQFICIDSSSTLSSEMRYTSAATPGEFVVFSPRQADWEYSADHLDGRWVIHTNWDAKNFKIMTTPTDTTHYMQWQEWVAHEAEVLVEGFELFDGFTAIAERTRGLERIRLRFADEGEEFVAVDEPAYSMWLSINSETDTFWLRYSYTSLTTPVTMYELNVQTGERRELKQQVVHGYDASQYITERIWVAARDGVQVPVSLVYKKGFVKDGTAGLYQYAYGSYGSSTDPIFNMPVVSLLDRGMVYAIAHVRGGQELGRYWYEDGKLLNKKNTFTDFIDVSNALVVEGYAAADRVAASGGSAGGLLVGAVANMAADRYRVMVAQVPFVDVVTTMLDTSIPLTTNEYDEWGNPGQVEYYDYILSYSPYDNVRRQAYPALFVGTGLWDSQVQYWEPAKWVAKLRDENMGTHPILFRTNMEAGHGGKSGRFRRYRELSEGYAFMLSELDVVRD